MKASTDIENVNSDVWVLEPINHEAEADTNDVNEDYKSCNCRYFSKNKFKFRSKK